ncbi:MAG: hypothetical protein O7B81_02240 [Gammaproteobacteria bacterium]|nr:hypothetical protein [Gammaproteobacteria bacterium]
MIEPASFKIRANEADMRTSGGRSSLKVVLAASAISFLVFMLFVVVVVLPKWVAGPEVPAKLVQGSEITPNEPDPEGTAGADAGEISQDRETTDADRTNTQDLLRSALEKLDSLESMDAESWAKTEIHLIRERIAEGEKAYREKRYVAAKNSYLDSVERIERLLSGIPDIVEKLTDVGYLALDNGDSVQAAGAFDEVLAIDPDHARAKHGRARAETLDQVLALVGQAEGYERMQQIDKALTANREAVKIDPDAPGAAAAITRFERAERESAFRIAMSSGFRAFEIQEFRKAREAFQRAVKLDPNAPEAKSAIKQTDNAEASFKIERYLGGARKAEREEQWHTAAKQFEAALKIDPRLSPAIAAKQNAEMRHRLDVKLTAYLARTDRFSADAVHEEASRILASAQGVPTPGRLLQKQIADLSHALKLARTPVAVSLQSDNLTAVTIYRIGDLGRFEVREVPLLPGEYTAVGKRDGYRDVRVEFVVKPVAQGPVITVRCDEQFAFGS